MQCRPVQLAADLGRRYPDAWRQAEAFRLNPPTRWPDWCFLPMAAAYAIVSAGGMRPVTIANGDDIAAVAALSTWRVTQGIYRFDPDLLEAVWTTPVDGPIPVDVLERLPEWCVYVETPGRGMHGFFAHLEWDPNDGRRELRFLVDADEGLSPLMIHLHPGRTLEDGLQAVAERCTQRARDLGNPFRPQDFNVSPRDHGARYLSRKSRGR